MSPDWAPKIPEGYGPQTRAEFWKDMWHGLAPMTFLMVIVLGSIFAGWATATESAGVGVLGSFFIAWLNKRLTLPMVKDAIRDACKANAMVFMLFLGATGFSYVFRALGGDDLMIATLAHFGIDTKWEILGFVMVLIFLLGFPFEWIEICLIVLPVFMPILAKLDFAEHLGSASFFMSLVRDAGGGEPANLFHDAAVRRHALLPRARCPPGHDGRRLPGMYLSSRCRS